MEYKLVIPGRLPGLNEYIDAERRNRYAAAKLKSDAQKWIGLCIAKSLPGLHLTKPVVMHYAWYEPSRRRDPSNVCAYGRKLIEDALVQRGVLADDGWGEIAGFTDVFDVDKTDPRIVVMLREVEK